MLLLFKYVPLDIMTNQILIFYTDKQICLTKMVHRRLTKLFDFYPLHDLIKPDHVLI